MRTSRTLFSKFRRSFPFVFGAIATGLLVSSCANQPTPEVVILMDDSESKEEEKVDFVSTIAPVLSEKCVTCHYDNAQLTALSFQRRADLLAQSALRPILVPGEPEKSTLFLVTVMPDYFVEAMPPSGHRLSDVEAADLYRWIKQGADWPEDLVLKRPPDA